MFTKIIYCYRTDFDPLVSGLSGNSLGGLTQQDAANNPPTDVTGMSTLDGMVYTPGTTGHASTRDIQFPLADPNHNEGETNHHNHHGHDELRTDKNETASHDRHNLTAELV